MGFFSKDIKTLDDLFVHTLRDIYYAEKQIETALPKMIMKAGNGELKAGFEKHLEQTHGHVARLEEVSSCMASAPGRSTARRSTGSSRRPRRFPATSTIPRCWTPR